MIDGGIYCVGGHECCCEDDPENCEFVDNTCDWGIEYGCYCDGVCKKRAYDRSKELGD